MELARYDCFIATFKPQRTDDLKPGAEKWVGRRLEWEAVWEIDEDDGGPYVGDFACSPHLWPGDGAKLPFVWVPERDLKDIRVLSSLQPEL